MALAVKSLTLAEKSEALAAESLTLAVKRMALVKRTIALTVDLIVKESAEDLY